MKRGKVVLLSIGLVLVSLATVGWALVRRHSIDPYDFLRGRGVAHVGVIGPGSFAAKEIRTYTWRQPWAELVKEARPEMNRLKMEETLSTKAADKYVLWQAGLVHCGPCGASADVSIYALPGRALPLRQFGPQTDRDPEWVTVIVSSTLDENWINVIRYTFFSIPER
jgi:hypothetical protein